MFRQQQVEQQQQEVFVQNFGQVLNDTNWRTDHKQVIAHEFTSGNFKTRMEHVFENPKALVKLVDFLANYDGEDINLDRYKKSAFSPSVKGVKDTVEKYWSSSSLANSKSSRGGNPKVDLLNFIREISDNPNIEYNLKVANSEKKTGFRNSAMINLMRAFGNIKNDIEDILDYNFTAKVEQDFDEIAEGNIDWANMMQDFYNKFHPNVQEVEKNADRESGERILGKHPETGKTVLVRLGKFGAMAQIGDADDEEKQFASLRPEQNMGNISLEEALKLFLLPKSLGDYKGEEVEVSNGRFGPYVRFGKQFISLPKGEEPLDVTMERAKELIDEKVKADAPIATYKNMDVQKGVGRFGPFLKWNGIFINVNKKYNFDNLSQSDVAELIEEKLQKDIDKVIHNWSEEGILVQKARWGRSEITKGKIKIELSKDIDAAALTLEQVKEMIAKKTPEKKTATKKTATKKAPAKKK
jgi:topoisomerase IA-like protein